MSKIVKCINCEKEGKYSPTMPKDWQGWLMLNKDKFICVGCLREYWKKIIEFLIF